MKYVLLLIVLSASVVLAESPKKHRLNAEWNQMVTFLKMDDNESLVVRLPYREGTTVTADITGSYQMIDECHVLGISRRGNFHYVTFKLGETDRDDGFNGCLALITRHHTDKRRAPNVLRLEFGYYLDN